MANIDFSDKNIKLRIFIGIISVVLWAIYITVILTTENKATVLLYISIISLIALFISFFSKKISEAITKEDEKEREIKSVGEAELEKIEEGMINKYYWTWIKKGVPLIRRTKTINGNIISIREVELVHERQIRSKDGGYKKTNRVTIIINSTFPKMAVSIIPTEDEKFIEEIINDKAMSPHTPTSVRKSEVGIDQFNRPTQTVEEISYQEDKKEAKESVV